MYIGLENTSQYDLYEDETKNKLTFSQLAEELESIEEVGDHYIGAEIVFLKEDEMARNIWWHKVVMPIET